MLIDGVPEWPQDTSTSGTQGDVMFLVFPQGGARLRVQVAPLGLAATFRFAGYGRGLDRVYQAVDLLVLPSLGERLPNVVLEAMASGTPVVASHIGGVPEVVQDGQTGFLTPPGDVDALRGRLERLLHDPALARRLGANARAAVLERFTWAKVAARCLEAYADLRVGS